MASDSIINIANTDPPQANIDLKNFIPLSGRWLFALYGSDGALGYYDINFANPQRIAIDGMNRESQGITELGGFLWVVDEDGRLWKIEVA